MNAISSYLSLYKFKVIRTEMDVRETIICNIGKHQLPWQRHKSEGCKKKGSKDTDIMGTTGKKKKGQPYRTQGEGIRRSMSDRGLTGEQAVIEN